MTERRTSILSARAQALLQALPAGFEQVSSLAVIVFSMGEERAGVRLSSAREVVPVGQMAAIPGAPPYLRGLAQVRGELLCVLDLLAFWRPGRQTAGGHLIVVESSAGAMALLADAIEDVRDIDCASRLRARTGRERGRSRGRLSARGQGRGLEPPGSQANSLSLPTTTRRVAPPDCRFPRHQPWRTRGACRTRWSW